MIFLNLKIIVCIILIQYTLQNSLNDDRKIFTNRLTEASSKLAQMRFAKGNADLIDLLKKYEIIDNNGKLIKDGEYQDPPDWTTKDFMVPMRDGTKLWTEVTFPDYLDPFGDGPSNITTVYQRSPYTGWPENLALLFVFEGYASVVQDMRGTHKSEGAYDTWRTDAIDFYDTCQWISEQSWSNKIVVTHGISANGIAEYLAPISNPTQWLKASGIMLATNDLWGTMNQGGCYREALFYGWLKSNNHLNVVPKLVQHELYSNWWKNTNSTDAIQQNVNYPAVHYAGWYDIFQQATIDGFNRFKNATSAKQKLIIEAQGHCRAGVVDFPSDRFEIVDYSGVILDMYAKAGNGGNNNLLEKLNKKILEKDGENAKLIKTYDSLGQYTWYVMGPQDSNYNGVDGLWGNYWTTGSSFPAFTNKVYYLNKNGTLTDHVGGYDSTTYIYDPMNPVKTNGGNNLEILCGIQDQSDKEARDDVLSFTTAAFTKPMAITGRVKVILEVASSAIDTDFMVQYTDVTPDGQSLLLQDSGFRMRFREGSDHFVAMKPGQMYEIEVDLWSISFVFNKGHKLRVSVTSSNAPRFNPNYNNMKGLQAQYNNVSTPIVAKNTVFFGGKSRIILPHVRLSDMPANV